MSLQTKAAASPAPRPAFRNAHQELDDRAEKQLVALELKTSEGAGSSTSADSSFACFIAAAYFQKVPWPKLLHYIVHNVPDTRELPIWRAIISARRLYRLLNSE